MARNSTMVEWGFLTPDHFMIHDPDTTFCSAFRETINAAGVRLVKLPPRSPNLNAYAERWVRSVKEEVLSRLILFGEDALRKVLNEYGPIIIRNAIIREEAMNYCCHGRGKRVGAPTPFTLAKDWVDC